MNVRLQATSCLRIPRVEIAAVAILVALAAALVPPSLAAAEKLNAAGIDALIMNFTIWVYPNLAVIIAHMGMPEYGAFLDLAR